MGTADVAGAGNLVTHEGVPPPGASVREALDRAVKRLAGNKLVTLGAYAGFVFVKVLAVSDWRLGTALEVLNLSSLPAIVAGATLSALPTLSLLLLSSVVFLCSSGYWQGTWLPPFRTFPNWRGRVVDLERRNRMFYGATFLLGALVFAVASWSLTLIAVGIAAALGLPARSMSARAVLRPLFGLVMLLLLYAQVVSSVWLPHEAVVHGDRGKLTVGYVVGESDQDVTVLVSRTRLLVLIPVDSITRRFVCYPQETGFGGVLPVEHESFLNLIVNREPSRDCVKPRAR